MRASGGEEQSEAQSGIIRAIGGLIIALLAKPLVSILVSGGATADVLETFKTKIGTEGAAYVTTAFDIGMACVSVLAVYSLVMCGVKFRRKK